MAQPASRQATYADLEAVPEHLVAEEGVPSLASRRRHWLLVETVQTGELVRMPPFDAVAFPLSALFPFDTPPSTEA
jgi:hypothetical protein